MKTTTLLIKDTHRGLRYADGIMQEVLGPGFYEVPRQWNLPFYRTPFVEIVLVDVRERDLTIKGQEILTADKVAIRVSIIVQFKVTDPVPPFTKSATMMNVSTATCNSPPVGRSRR